MKFEIIKNEIFKLFNNDKEKSLNDELNEIGILDKDEKDEWLEHQIETLENCIRENKSVAFKIKNICEKGFVVNVNGLNAFIHFDHMPWYYSSDYWKAIQQQLKGKIFFGNIFQFSKESLPLSIIINGEIPQFKKAALTLGEKYTGIIIKKLVNAVLVEIGYHFEWNCGSIVGLLSYKQFENIKSFKNCNKGDIIQVIFCGYNNEGKIYFSQQIDYFDWKNNIPQALLEQIVSVQIVRNTDNNEISYLVNGKYKGSVNYKKSNYSLVQRKIIKERVNNYKHSDIIQCKVIRCNDIKRVLILKWNLDIEESIDKNKGRNKIKDKDKTKNNIINNIQPDTLQKLISMCDEFNILQKDEASKM